ncbi:MAG TPA: hypothetical protein RMH99_32715 [Sandaracinaceae bacterium LLY-WYZ-13_1]|nr:hypothetical protein [Sandaracinaceae bacterium LLY-WYZ-13_1]
MPNPFPARALRRWRRHATTLALVGAFGALGAGTSSSDEESSETPESEAAPATGGSDVLNALERHMNAGQPYGEGPDGAAIAQALQRRYPDDAIAVRVIPGSPRVIVALVRFTDLSRIPDDERRDYIDSFASTLDLRFLGSQARIGIGLKGRLLFGAVATREPGAPLSTEIGGAVSDDPLEALLATPAGSISTAPSIAVGDAQRGTFDASDDFGNRRWVLTLAQPTTVHLVARRTDDVQGPTANGVWSIICAGNTFNSDCATLRDDDTNEARLAAGTYTIFSGIAPGCDVDADSRCWKVPTPYEVELTQL